MKKLEVSENGLGLLYLYNDVFFEALVFESRELMKIQFV